jgi:hypothetical protein
VLRQITDFSLGLAGPIEEIDALDRYAPGAWRQVAGNHLHGGRLAGAVRTEESQHLPLRQFETDSVDRQIVAIVAVQLFYADQDFGVHLALWLNLVHTPAFTRWVSITESSADLDTSYVSRKISYSALRPIRF